MNNEEISKELREQRNMIEQIYISVEKTRKYFLWTMIATLVAFILPLIAMAFVIPYFMSSYSGLISGAGLGL
jgi:type IV secretory pathway component VirB8